MLLVQSHCLRDGLRCFATRVHWLDAFHLNVRIFAGFVLAQEMVVHSDCVPVRSEYFVVPTGTRLLAPTCYVLHSYFFISLYVSYRMKVKKQFINSGESFL